MKSYSDDIPNTVDVDNKFKAVLDKLTSSARINMVFNVINLVISGFILYNIVY